MRIVSWNVGSNTGYQADRAARQLVALHADIALLQEVDAARSTFAVFEPCTDVTSWGSAIVTDYD
jgi:hypothetical protein